ncbi:uncharacterized protein [Amphiura filiformis]|uniref:uncharacterized protein n=1 Tax=Amphiura filiformis TaxID=82378 RepID=UPI003B222DF7
MFDRRRLRSSKAINIAVASEAASKDTDMLHKGGNVNKVHSTPKRFNRNRGQQQPRSQHKPPTSMNSNPKYQGTTCYRCGEPHNANVCKYKTYKCNYCKKVGHLAKVCRKKQTSGTNYVDEQSMEEVEDNNGTEMHETCNYLHTLGIHNLPGSNSSDPIMVTVDIDGKAIPMEVDTGAAMSIIPHDVFNAKFSHVKLSKCESNFSTYGGGRLPVVGQGEVTVTYRSQIVKLPL